MNDILELIAALYDGPLEDEPFASFLARLRAWLGGNAAVILIERQRRDRPGVILASGAITPAGSRDYLEHFKDDPFIDLPQGKVTTLHEHLGAALSERSEFVRATDRWGATYVLGVDIEAAGTKVRVRTTRAMNTGDFGSAEKERLNSIVPHLTRALSLFLRLTDMAAERDLYAGTLARLGLGTIVVDANGAILEASPTARALLGEGDVVAAQGSYLRLPHDPAAGRALADLIAANADAAAKGTEPPPARALRVMRANGTSVGLIVRPAPASPKLDLPVRAAAVVTVADPERDVAPQAQTLSQLFGLTGAEAELGVLLAQGLDLDHASETLGIAKSTARTQLRAIFAKTGATRQAALVRLFLRSVDELV